MTSCFSLIPSRLNAKLRHHEYGFDAKNTEIEAPSSTYFDRYNDVTTILKLFQPR